jgi:hypothetical protein
VSDTGRGPGTPGTRGPVKDGRYVGERERHRSRQTGVMVVLIDTHESPAWLPQDEGRWATLCDDHGFVGYWPSLGAARAWYAYPARWCPLCQGVADHGG